MTNYKKIIGIGWNYSNHAKEMMIKVPKEPIFFLKPSSSLTKYGPIEIPDGAIVHHEIELAVIIGKTGRFITQENAFDHIKHYALALDMTARNIQLEAKAAGMPWTVSKGYDTFAPIGDPIYNISNPHQLQLTLKVDGEIKQNGFTKDMVFKIPRLIEYVSSIMTLEAGDIILTGTPDGVGPVVPGQTLKEGSSFGMTIVG
ncbi:hypothetical protein BC833DRAFT_615221 [Globomyces pollinis-pini]|nr:hypothetical protein BC833DRAFT_615221 [Globomyces pollinis-pini]